MAKKVKRSKNVRSKYAPEVVMSDFRTLTQAMPYMNDEELRAALVLEVSRPKADRRTNLIELLHRRIVNRKIKEFKKGTDADLARIKEMRKEAAAELSGYLS